MTGPTCRNGAIVPNPVYVIYMDTYDKYRCWNTVRRLQSDGKQARWHYDPDKRVYIIEVLEN